MIIKLQKKIKKVKLKEVDHKFKVVEHLKYLIQCQVIKDLKWHQEEQ